MRNKILQWLPLAVLLIAWEAYAKFQSGFSTMFSSPVRIITLLYEKTVSGDLPYHTFITAYESFVGLLFNSYFRIGSSNDYLVWNRIENENCIGIPLYCFYYCFSNL